MQLILHIVITHIIVKIPSAAVLSETSRASHLTLSASHYLCDSTFSAQMTNSNSKHARPSRPSRVLSVAEHSAVLASYGAPLAPSKANPEALGKLGHRVAQALIDWAERPDDDDDDDDDAVPQHTARHRRIPPQQIGVAPANRGGAHPNLQVLHKRITTSFKEKGYDPSRHLPPIVVRCRSEKARKALIAYNKSWTEGRDGFPKVHEKR